MRIHGRFGPNPCVCYARCPPVHQPTRTTIDVRLAVNSALQDIARHQPRRSGGKLLNPLCILWIHKSNRWPLCPLESRDARVVRLTGHSPRSEQARRATVDLKSTGARVEEFSGSLPQGELGVYALFGSGCGGVAEAAALTREALIFGVAHRCLCLDGGGVASGALPFPKTAKLGADEADECARKANTFGRWIANAGTPSTVMSLFGVRP